MDSVLEILMAVVGTFGFCLIFNIRKSLLIYPCIGAALCWSVYLLAENSGFNCFAASCFSAMAVGVFGEIVARIVHAPTTVFFIPACVPLIPGSALYRTMFYAVRSDWTSFRRYGSLTIQCAMGIAAGLAVIQAVVLTEVKIKTMLKRNQNENG